MERFADFRLHAENLIRYHVTSHHTPILGPKRVDAVLKEFFQFCGVSNKFLIYGDINID